MYTKGTIQYGTVRQDRAVKVGRANKARESWRGDATPICVASSKLAVTSSLTMTVGRASGAGLWLIIPAANSSLLIYARPAISPLRRAITSYVVYVPYMAFAEVMASLPHRGKQSHEIFFMYACIFIYINMYLKSLGTTDMRHI